MTEPPRERPKFKEELAKEMEITTEKAKKLNKEIDEIMDYKPSPEEQEKFRQELKAKREKEKNKSKKKPIVLTSKVVLDGVLYEQVYDGRKSYYLRWDEKTQKAIPYDSVEDQYQQYIPIMDEGLEKKAVILPTGVTEYGNTSALEQNIHDFNYEYLDISIEHRQKATWYIMLSWVLDKLNTIPYLRVLGDWGTGKTRYEDVVGGLCYKPMFMSGAVRSPPVYRIMNLWHGTAIIDEFTLSKSDETEDIIKILNCGYQRGKPVIRCASNDYDKLKYFDPFCPKIIASRKQFTDKALESRCITEIMQVTTRDDIPIELTKSFYRKQGELRNQLLLYRFKNWNKINPDVMNKIEFGNILPRVKQSFMPFTVLFQHDQSTLHNFIQGVKQYNEELIMQNSTTMEGLMIKIYLDLNKAGEKNITTGDIHSKLVVDYKYSNKLYVGVVGKHLKTLGFQSKSEKFEIGGKKKAIRKLYIDENRLKSLITKYIPTQDQDEAIRYAKPRSLDNIMDEYED